MICSKQANESVMAVDFCKGKGVSGSAAGSVVLWRLNVDGGELERQLEKLTIVEERRIEIKVGVSVVRIRGDGRLVAIGDFEGRVHLMGGKSLKYLVCIPYHTESLFDVCFVPSNNHFAICSNQHTISFWDLYS